MNASLPPQKKLKQGGHLNSAGFGGAGTKDNLEFIARATVHIPSKGWAEMIRKVYKVNFLLS